MKRNTDILNDLDPGSPSENGTHGSATFQDTMHQIAAEELDLEIGIRTRLLEVLQGRIAWAEQLREILKSGSQDQTITQDEFKLAAIDALSAIEEPCQDLFPRERLYRRPVPPFAATTSVTASEVLPKGSLRSSRSRGPNRGRPSAPAVKLLFIRYADPDSPISTPIVAKLTCTDCQRTDFPSVQGLINHCRMRHSRTYGSHDECVAACAVPIQEDPERDWTLTNGTEVAAGPGVRLPSLRRLFAMAVGEGREVAPSVPLDLPEIELPMVKAEENLTHARGSQEATFAASKELSDGPSSSSVEKVAAKDDVTHLSRTLGHHKDSPALANFLGREAKRRHINVYDESDDVDIGDGSLVPATPAAKSGWRMAFGLRSRAEGDDDASHAATEDLIDGLEGVAASPTTESSSGPARAPQTPEGSRFHITTRIIITDKSRWIPLDARSIPNPDHTHQWMITVDSPSYARHVSTVVDRVVVTCITDTAKPIFSDTTTNITQGPAYYVRGTTDQPFLAQVEIHWAPSTSDHKGVLANPPMKVEQWVDIGPEKYLHPVNGEDQVLDIELDRNTVFKERQLNTGFTWEDRGTLSSTTQSTRSKTSTVDDTSEHGSRLQALLPRFPLTMKDVKMRHLPRVTYALVPTVAHLKSLTYGRRKAIELGRSRALCEAYNADIASTGDHNGLPPLRPADVFRWLEENGHFARPAPILVALEEKGHPGAPETGFEEREPAHFCHCCGLDLRWHPQSLPGAPECSLVSPAEKPLVGLLDVNKLMHGLASSVGTGLAYGFSREALFPLAPASASVPEPGWTPSRTRSLLSAADPDLVWAIFHLMSAATRAQVDGDVDEGGRRAVEGASPTIGGRFDRSAYGGDRLAVSALLALTLKSFVARLVSCGVAHLRRQHASLRPVAIGANIGLGGKLLTPYHILRGVREGAAEDGCGTATFVALSTLGITLPGNAVEQA